MNISNLEKSVLLYLSGKLDMMIDIEGGLFRGRIPEGVKTGVAVLITSAVNKPDIHIPEYELQIIGRFFSRDEVFDFISSITELAPVYGVDLGSFCIQSLEQQSNAEPYTNVHDGRLMYYCSVRFLLSVTSY